MSSSIDPSRASGVALVSGGGTGIGAAITRSLRDVGWEVVVFGRRMDRLAEIAEATGAVPIAADVTDAVSPARVMAEVRERFGRLDALVLNAAVSRPGRFADLTDDDWRTMTDTNLVGAARLSRAALPALVETRGSIVGVASLAALRASSFMSGYAASKAGLGLMLQSIAVEYGKRGVRANLICPGLVRTDMSAESLALLADQRGIGLDDAFDLATANVPLRRAGTPEEIAGVVRFLVSADAGYLTGAVIPVDGGASAVDVAALVYESDH
ncbi:SDR family oxidoreductase [Microbacterium sp. NPDC077184]|uniref:SDR family NAD(P)-dependent oxidoreductase n=1 Tax=Microbacterium sp. NPDC077184 TaxID=3154764 RepID=UPI00341CBA1D